MLYDNIFVWDIKKILTPIDRKQLDIYYDISNGIELFKKGLNASEKEISGFFELQSLFMQYEQLNGRKFLDDYNILEITKKIGKKVK